MGITNGNGMGMGMKTRLNLGVGMGMGMNHWEWEGMGLKSHSRSSLSCTDIKITFFGRKDAVLRTKFPLFGEIGTAQEFKIWDMYSYSAVTVMICSLHYYLLTPDFFVCSRT